MQELKWVHQIDATLIDVNSINLALESKHKMIRIKSMFKIIESRLYDDKTILILQQLSKCFDADIDQVMGLYMLGHFSMATLYEICNKDNFAIYKSIYDTLESDIKNQIDILIETKSLYL